MSVGKFARYALFRVTEQCRCVIPLVLVLIFFELVVLQAPTFDYASIILGNVAVIVGLAVFTHSLEYGLMPIAELVGTLLPVKFSFSVVMVIAGLLGAAVTIAEPAFGVLQAASQWINRYEHPFLYTVLHDTLWSTMLVITVAIGVGFASMLGLLRIVRGWSLKPMLYGLVPVTVLLSFMLSILPPRPSAIASLHSHSSDAIASGTGSASTHTDDRTSLPTIRELIALAWDLGAITTGPVTVPIVVALGIGAGKFRQLRGNLDASQRIPLRRRLRKRRTPESTAAAVPSDDATVKSGTPGAAGVPPAAGPAGCISENPDGLLAVPISVPESSGFRSGRRGLHSRSSSFSSEQFDPSREKGLTASARDTNRKRDPSRGDSVSIVVTPTSVAGGEFGDRRSGSGGGAIGLESLHDADDEWDSDENASDDDALTPIANRKNFVPLVPAVPRSFRRTGGSDSDSSDGDAEYPYADDSVTLDGGGDGGGSADSAASGMSGFGIVTLASLCPVITVLLFAFVLQYYGTIEFGPADVGLVTLDATAAGTLPRSLAEAAVAATSTGPNKTSSAMAAHLNGSAAASAAAIAPGAGRLNVTDHSIAHSVNGSADGVPALEWYDVQPYSSIIFAMRSLIPLILILIGLLKWFLKASIPRVPIPNNDGADCADSSSTRTYSVFYGGLIYSLPGLILFYIGLQYGLVLLGTEVGQRVPGLFLPIPIVDGSPLFDSAFLGELCAALFVGVLGFGATWAEPALQTVASTVDRLTHGEFTHRMVMMSVSVGVGVGLGAGMSMVVHNFPVELVLSIGYSMALILTVFSKEEFVALAWDAAGVTTGPVTVPLVIAIGLGLAIARPIRSAFGLLAISSMTPILSVLLTGLWIQFLRPVLVRYASLNSA